jgi:murein DD-endopeptidase MepM/ murein hydrolase activator NlpD
MCGRDCHLTHRLGIGGTTFDSDLITPIHGTPYEVFGFGPGVGDHQYNDYWAVDFTSNMTAVYSVRPGEVVYSGPATSSSGPTSYGNVVVVYHGDGVYSVYTHLADDGRASEGSEVTPADEIGTMSDSGCNDVPTCPVHLHFAMRLGPTTPVRGVSAAYVGGRNQASSVRTPWCKVGAAGCSQ